MINKVTEQIVHVQGELYAKVELVEELILEDDEIDMERIAENLQVKLIDFQRGKISKEEAEKVIQICNTMGWRIVFEPNCFTGDPEPVFITGKNRYVSPFLGCDTYHPWFNPYDKLTRID